jgi:hypothetical protein
LERGIAAEMADVIVKGDNTLGKNDKGVEISLLKIETTAPESLTTGIPSGLLGYVSMRISETGRPAKFGLRASVEATELNSKVPIKDLRVVDGLVEVMAPGTEQPSAACFFFSH